MPVPDYKKRANAKWDKANMATLACKLRKEQAAAFRIFAAEKGKAPNALIKEFVLSCIDGMVINPDS